MGSSWTGWMAAKTGPALKSSAAPKMTRTAVLTNCLRLSKGKSARSLPRAEGIEPRLAKSTRQPENSAFTDQRTGKAAAQFRLGRQRPGVRLPAQRAGEITHRKGRRIRLFHRAIWSLYCAVCSPGWVIWLTLNCDIRPVPKLKAPTNQRVTRRLFFGARVAILPVDGRSPMAFDVLSIPKRFYKTFPNLRTGIVLLILVVIAAAIGNFHPATARHRCRQALRRPIHHNAAVPRSRHASPMYFILGGF